MDLDKLYNEDCIAGLASRVADDSIHLTVTSIPFEELFTYSGKLEDVGNNGSTINIRTSIARTTGARRGRRS